MKFTPRGKFTPG